MARSTDECLAQAGVGVAQAPGPVWERLTDQKIQEGFRLLGLDHRITESCADPNEFARSLKRPLRPEYHSVKIDRKTGA
jgi:hypothetical protein